VYAPTIAWSPPYVAASGGAQFVGSILGEARRIPVTIETEHERGAEIVQQTRAHCVARGNATHAARDRRARRECNGMLPETVRHFFGSFGEHARRSAHRERPHHRAAQGDDCALAFGSSSMTRTCDGRRPHRKSS
jgi:hypothetical protein